MAQKILTSSIEAATLGVGNGGNSNLKLLKNRDRRVKGVNVDVAQSATMALTIQFSGNVQVNAAALLGVTTTAAVALEFYYTSGATSDGSITSATYDNDDVWYEFAGTRNTDYYYIYMNPDTTAEMYCGAIFLGVSVDFPSNYRYNNTRDSFMRNVTVNDDYGYPYSYQLNQAKKFNFDLTWSMGKSNLITLENGLVDCGYSAKPFVYYDSNIANEISNDFNTCFLVKLPDNISFRTQQPGADYFNVGLNMVQL